jgi:hypothetical protein
MLWTAKKDDLDRHCCIHGLCVGWWTYCSRIHAKTMLSNV